MGIKLDLPLDKIQDAVETLKQIDKVEELLYNARMYKEDTKVRQYQRDLSVLYRYAADKLRWIANYEGS